MKLLALLQIFYSKIFRHCVFIAMVVIIALLNLGQLLEYLNLSFNRNPDLNSMTDNEEGLVLFSDLLLALGCLGFLIVGAIHYFNKYSIGHRYDFFKSLR